jgi:hypothetical protein
MVFSQNIYLKFYYWNFWSTVVFSLRVYNYLNKSKIYFHKVKKLEFQVKLKNIYIYKI